LTLRLLRFDIAAPLLGFSAPSAVATLLAGFALGAGRPSDWLIDTLTSRRTGAVVMRWLLRRPSSCRWWLAGRGSPPSAPACSARRSAWRSSPW
jgi:hypothetical protein